MTLTGGGACIGEHRIHRWIFDCAHNYFGYELHLDSNESGTEHRLAFLPLSMNPDQFLPPQLRVARRSAEQIPLKELPPPQTLRRGRALEFRLSTADGKHNVIERIKFSKPPKAVVPLEGSDGCG